MEYQLVLGTLFLTSFYLLAGFNKLTNFKSTSDSFAKKFVNLAPLAGIIIGLVILLEIVAPLVMIYSVATPNANFRYGYMASWALIIFTVFATLVYHFPPTVKENKMPFLRNVSLIGAFIIYNNLRI